MSYPPDWRENRAGIPKGDEEPLGHQDRGLTIAIHSLAVRPEHQKKHVGTTLMLAYIQRIKDAAIADRIALLVHRPLIPFYERLGFKYQGPSGCKFGGGHWFDLVSIIGNIDAFFTQAYAVHQVLEFPKPPDRRT
jgi:GNAT superfamily N-acetyltransferase